jgi:hypothetical protein
LSGGDGFGRRVFGVDFSGADNAGDLIWIAEVAPFAGGRTSLLSCRPARELPGGARDRATALAALARLITTSSHAAFGCDFPFSLPAALSLGQEWAAFVAGFPGRFADADAFRADCMARGGGRELKRPTDRETQVPFGAYNIRLYRQTFHGIGGLLAPLLGRVAAPPMQPALPDRPVLLETCPASTLRRLGLYGRSYKGPAAIHRAHRQGILDGLVDAGLMEPPAPALAERLMADRGGDALDSAVAAIACAGAIAAPGYDQPRDAAERFEGRVYR